MWSIELVESQKRRLLYKFDKLNAELKVSILTVGLLVLGRVIDFFLEVLGT